MFNIETPHSLEVHDSQYCHSTCCVLFVSFCILGFVMFTKARNYADLVLYTSLLLSLGTKYGGIDSYDIIRVYRNLLRNSQIFSWPFRAINYPVSASDAPSKY